MTPEQQARQQIDAMLVASGWIVQDYKAFNPSAARGIALREVPLKSGRCDYLLLVDRNALGVVEAKKEGMTLSTVAEQSAHYGENLPDFIQAIAPGSLPFLYESTGVETFFRDERDPDPRSRHVFSFHRPETLAEWLTQPDTLRARLQHLPPLPTQGMSAKREHVLALPLDAYKKWADKLSDGFFEADRFLRMEGFHHPKFLPYRSQIIPLAATMVHLGERWLEPVIRQKLARWYWSGVLGELYGGAIETRIANDLVNLLAWIDDPAASEPVTVVAAGFQPSRLDTLRTRTSAAYRGIYVLLQRQGSKDFFWKARMVDLDRDECKIDIHHIFPRDWCDTQNIAPKVFNSIINKTPISYKANRMIGGKAPSKYLQQIQSHAQVQVSEAEQDEILKSHLIAPGLLRADDFTGFMAARKAALLEVISAAMGKEILPAGGDAPAEDEEDEEGED